METVADEAESGVASSVTNVELGLSPTKCRMGQAVSGIEDSFGGRQRRSPSGATGNGETEGGVDRRCIRGTAGSASEKEIQIVGPA